MQKFGLPLILVAIVATMIGIFIVGGGAGKSSPQQAVTLIGDKHPNQGQKHLKVGETNHNYNSNPPSSGDHAPSPEPWGIKASEVADETLVHNVEHGGIVIAYKPDLPADQLVKLKQLFGQLTPSSQFNEVKAVLVPRSKNDSPISIAAWTYTLHIDSVDEAKIKQFYDGHLDKGPEMVP